jgi:hypothetical protein
MKLKVEKLDIVDHSDWDDFVEAVYGRPYCFQQQDGCKGRGTFEIYVPNNGDDEYLADSIPEEVNGEEMGVKFSTWLARDPKAPLGLEDGQDDIELFYHRNFYPDIEVLANDLHERGHLPAGEYTILIDW